MIFTFHQERTDRINRGESRVSNHKKPKGKLIIIGGHENRDSHPIYRSSSSAAPPPKRMGTTFIVPSNWTEPIKPVCSR